MLAPTGRFTTLIAGAVVFGVITTAFFVVFDLNTAAGSSEGLPVVEIGRGDSMIASAAASPNASPAVDDQQQQGAEGTGSLPATSGSGLQEQSAQGAGQSQSSATAPEVGTDSTTREYVEEEVQVKGRRPDPKTEHPGQGVGLTKNPKD